MIEEYCPLPSPVEAGTFLVSGFIEFELKGSMPIPSVRGFSVVRGFF